MRNFILKYRVEVIVFVVAFLARVIFFSFGYSYNDGDLIKTIKGDDGYYELSQSIILGHGFTFDTEEPFRPNPLRPPVWPHIIAGLVFVFKSYWAVLIFEVVVGSLIPVLGMHIAKRIFENRSVWIGTGFLLALEPYSIFLSTVMYTETSFTTFFLLFFLFLVRYFKQKDLRSLIWMTVFLALSCLIKPTVQYVPILVALGILFESREALSRKIMGHVFLTVFLFTVIIFPWLYRNHVEFGVWGISAQPSYNLYVYLTPTVLAIDNHTDFKTEYEAFAAKPGFDENNINLATGDFYSAQAIDVIKEHKLALAKSVGTTLVTFFTHDGMLTFFQYGGLKIPNSLSKPALTLLVESPGRFAQLVMSYLRSPAVLVVLVRLGWIVVTLLMILEWLKLTKHKKWTPSLIAAFILIAYFASTTSINGLAVNARFRVPVNVFILAFALDGFLVFWSSFQRRFLKHA